MHLNPLAQEFAGYTGINSSAPGQALRDALHSGWLQARVPELAILWGIPQRAEHHPEIDTGVHTELVMEVAANLTTDPAVRFAALAHDLGKGATPASEWPAHIGHETRGAILVDAVCDRFTLPDRWRKLGVLTSVWHLHAHRAYELSPRKIVGLFLQTGLLYDRPLLAEFLTACEADKRGRAGRQETAYPQGAFLLELRDAVAMVAAPETRLNSARCDAVRHYMDSLPGAASRAKARPRP